MNAVCVLNEAAVLIRAPSVFAIHYDITGSGVRFVATATVICGLDPENSTRFISDGGVATSKSAAKEAAAREVLKVLTQKRYVEPSWAPDAELLVQLQSLRCEAVPCSVLLAARQLSLAIANAAAPVELPPLLSVMCPPAFKIVAAGAEKYPSTNGEPA